MMRSVSSSTGPLRPGTPVKTNTPLVPSTSISSNATRDAPVAS